jgi:hypothetical protein
MTVHPAALAAAAGWPVYVSNDLGQRAAPDQTLKTGWQFHVRCGKPGCGQSVFCAGNDSGAYQWTIGGELSPGLIGHLMQCHRADIGLAPEEPG